MFCKPMQAILRIKKDIPTCKYFLFTFKIINLQEYPCHPCLRCDTIGLVAVGAFPSLQAYDLTKFAKVHPGGAKLITDAAGMDATAIFDPIHPKVLHCVSYRQLWLKQISRLAYSILRSWPGFLGLKNGGQMRSQYSFPHFTFLHFVFSIVPFIIIVLSSSEIYCAILCVECMSFPACVHFRPSNSIRWVNCWITSFGRTSWTSCWNLPWPWVWWMLQPSSQSTSQRLQRSGPESP